MLCVQILLSCGAEMTLMDGAGKTPLQLAEDAKMSGEMPMDMKQMWALGRGADVGQWDD